MVFKAKSIDIQEITGKNAMDVVFDFELVDGVTIVLSSVKTKMVIDNTLSTTDKKVLIATECTKQLQNVYNKYKAKKDKVTTFFDANKTALENYVNSHVTF